MSKQTQPGDALSLDSLMDEIDSTVNPGAIADTKAPKGSVDNPLTDDEDSEEEEKKEEKKVESKEKTDKKEVEDTASKIPADVDDKSGNESSKTEESEEVSTVDSDYGHAVASSLHKELGFEEDLDAKEFETEFGKGSAGLVNYIKQVIEDSSVVIHKTPAAERYYNYLSEGGDPEVLQDIIDAKTDYSKIEVEEENTELQRDLLFNYLLEIHPNKKEDWIQAKVKRAEDAGTLYDDSKDALDNLKEIYQEKEEKLIKEQEAATARRAKEIKEYWEREEDTVNKTSSIAGIELTDSLKKKFIAYQKAGKFSEEVRNPEKLRQLQFLAMVGIETINNSAKTKSAKHLDEVLQKVAAADNKTKVHSSTTPREQSPSDKLKPNFDELLG